jgi:Taurine catabolism dioxygenase TauD, TfdA family
MPVNLEIIPTGAALGAEVRGLDLSEPMDDGTFALIEHAYDEHGVLFFRHQRITPEQQVAFTRRFGEIEFNIFGERWSVPGCPEIVVVSNITDNGKPIGIRRAGENWHGHRAGRSSMRSRHRNFTACRSATPNSPAPRRRGTHCPKACAAASMAAALSLISRGASAPFRRPEKK